MVRNSLLIKFTIVDPGRSLRIRSSLIDCHERYLPGMVDRMSLYRLLARIELSANRWCEKSIRLGCNKGQAWIIMSLPWEVTLWLAPVIVKDFKCVKAPNNRQSSSVI